MAHDAYGLCALLALPTIRVATHRPFQREQRTEGQRQRHQRQPCNAVAAAGRLDQCVHRQRYRLGFARNVRHEGDGGADLTERVHELPRGTGCDAGKAQRQDDLPERRPKLEAISSISRDTASIDKRTERTSSGSTNTYSNPTLIPAIRRA